MHKNPERRPSINQIKSHPFFSHIDWELILSKKIAPPIDMKDLNKNVQEISELNLFTDFEYSETTIDGYIAESDI